MKLVINTYGTYLHVKDDLFEVRLPKEKGGEKRQVASQKVSSILISQGAALSTDAIMLAMKNNIDIVVLQQNGMPVGRFWHSRPGSTTRIRKCQLEASQNGVGLVWIQNWVGGKITQQMKFLKRLGGHRPKALDEIEKTVSRMETLRLSILALEAPCVDEVSASIRGFEGTASRLYFGLLSSLLIGKYQFNGRSTRPAKDPFNVFLNYSYGILYSRVEKALVIAGLDPFVGFMHRDDYNLKSMVFDYIEPYRIFADEVVFKLFSGKKVNDSHYDVITNGMTLNGEGKNLLIQYFMKFMEEDKVRYKGKNQTRANCIQLDAHDLANKLIGKK